MEESAGWKRTDMGFPQKADKGRDKGCTMHEHDGVTTQCFLFNV